MKGGKTYHRPRNKPATITLVLIAALVTSTLTPIAIGDPTTPQDTPVPMDRAITWNLQIELTEPGGGYDHVFICEAPDGRDGPPADSYDAVQPPPPPNPPYIRSYLNDGLAAPYNRLMVDCRHYPGVTKTWDLRSTWFSSDSETPTDITLSWNTATLASTEYDVVTLTNSSGTVLVPNMITTSSYTKENCPSDTPVRYFIVATKDVTPPSITDLSPDAGETGDSFTFTASVTDDMTPASSLLVKVNWQSGSLSGNDTMTYTTGTTFEKTITLSNDTTSPLTYHLYAQDTSKNQNSIYTTEQTATITDDEYPLPLSDDTTQPQSGEPMNFKLQIKDNIQISTLKAKYHWNGIGGWTPLDMTFVSGNQYTTADVTVPTDAASVQYYFEANDGTTTVYIYQGSLAVTTNEATAQALPFTKAVTDNDPPQLTDNSPTTGTTGDSYTFDVTATDNIGVQSVTVTWNHGSHSGTNQALTNTGGNTWQLTVTLDQAVSSMTYTITVSDVAGNTASTGLKTVTVTDNDNPSIFADNSPSTGTTGDSYTFEIDAHDNIGVTSVTVDWDHSTSGNPAFALTHISGTIWRGTITLAQSTSPMTYTVTVSDAAGHSVSGGLKTVTITDNDNPSIFADNSPTTGTTGDSYTFNIDARDNIGVTSVTVTWSHGGLSGTNVALTNTGGTIWQLTITLAQSTSSMTYTITVADAAGHSVSGGLKTVTVTDNDDPTIFADTSPATGTTGDSYTFNIDARDNIGVTSVTVTWNHGGLSGTNVALTNTGGTIWQLTITLAQSTSSMTYTITVADAAGHSTSGGLKTVTVTDNDDPTIFADTSPTTGTTGDSYTFTIDARDNIGVSSVTVTWNHGGLSGTNVALTNMGGTIWQLTITLAHSTSSMTYTIKVTDTAGRICTGSLKTVTVTDNDNPTIFADNSPTTGTTGDSYTFEIDAHDNIGVTSVTVDWDHGTSGDPALALTHISGTIWRATITLAHATTDMTYTVTVADAAGHTAVGSTKHVTVTDNDNPTIFADNSPITGTMGDSYTFNIDARDNIAVNSVTATWQHGSLSGTNVALTNTGGTIWELTITLDNSPSSMTYTITVTDTSGRTFTSILKTVVVTDVDDPYIFADASPATGTTGDSYTFNIDARDNQGVSTVKVTWHHGSLSGTNVAMTNTGGTIWEKTITLDQSVSSMTYTVTVTDTSGNSVTGSEQTVTVSDNDNPSIYADTSPTTGTTGDSYTFNIDARDNIGVSGVSVTWNHGGLSDTNVAMTNTGGTIWQLTIALDHSVSSMTYTVTVTDTSAHTFTGSLKTVTVTDNDNPSIYADNSPTTGTTGDLYTFEIDARDNIAVTSVTVAWNHAASGNPAFALTHISGTIWRGTITLANSLSDMTYTVTVADAAGHTAIGTLKHVTITDNDNPSIFADNSPITGTTGDSYTFNIDARDNIGVSGVTVTWHHGSLSGTNVVLTNTGGTIWQLTITLDQSVSGMTYTITVSDAAGHTFTSGLMTVTITDNDNPTIFADNSPLTGTTGDSYTFNIDARDNIGVSGVTVTWNHGVLSGTNVALTNTGGTIWQLTITLDQSLSTMTYTATASDAAGHSVSGGLKTVTITDNDNPTINTDSSPSSGTTGDSYTFNIDARDNIGVTSVTVNWDHDASGDPAFALTYISGTTWQGTITLAHSLSDMTYTVTVTDAAGHTAIGTLTHVLVSDNDVPVITNPAATPASQIIGGNVKVSATITDNIGLSQQKVTITGPIGFIPITVDLVAEGGNIYGYEQAYTILGTYDYTITAKDSSNLDAVPASGQFTIYSEIQITEAEPGWNFISLPFDQTITKDQLFVKVGEAEYTWAEAVTANIVENFWYNWLRTDPQHYSDVDVPSIVPGFGYWMLANEACEIWATGLSPIESTTDITELKTGWNLVGIPHNEDVDKTSLKVTYLSADYSWAEAVEAGIVLKDIFGWQRTAPQQYVILTMLEAGDAGWIYAYHDCTLSRTET